MPEIKREASVKINGAELRAALEKSGIPMIKASKIIGKNETYISEMSRRGSIAKDALASLCLLIGAKPEMFTVAEQPKKPAVTEQQKDTEEIFKALDEINGALFEIIQKQRVGNNEVTKTNVSIGTILAGIKTVAEATAHINDMCKKMAEANAEMAREQKRFFEESKKFFNGKKNYDVHGRWQ